jgi:ribosomal-protein-alanine N-acetyltransferase
MIKLETERLLLHPLNLDFCTQNYVDWLNDPAIYKYLETRGDQTIDSVKEFILKQIELKNYIWAIIIKDTKKHIGNIKIDSINLSHGYAEYGILMGDKNEWGKSFAKEASKRVIDYFFYENFNLRKINLGVVSENISAVNLYNKLGFIQEGYFKKHLKYNNIYHDLIRMSIFNPNFIYE